MYKLEKIATGGVLVIALSASVLTGCSNQVFKGHNYEYSDKKEYNDYFGVVINEINENGNYITRSNYFENYYILNSANKAYLNKYFYTYDLQSYDKKVSLEEFRKTTGIENPTYEMVIGSIDQNTHLTSEEKELLKKETDRIHKKYPDFDFTLFMYNMEDLDIRYIDSPSDFSSKFNPFGDCIIVNTRIAKTEEEQKEASKMAIGNMFTTATNVVDDKTIYTSDANYAVHIDYMYYSDKVMELGETCKKGFAAIVSNEEINGDKYPKLAEDAGILNMLLNMNDMTLAEYEKEGYEGLLTRMRLNGNNEMLFHVGAFDDPDEERNKCSIMCDLVDVYYRNLRDSGLSDEAINEIIRDMIEKSFINISRPSEITPFQFTGRMELLIWLEYKTRPQKEKTR